MEETTREGKGQREAKEEHRRKKNRNKTFVNKKGSGFERREEIGDKGRLKIYYVEYKFL